MRCFFTGSEADEISHVDSSPAIHLRRLFRLIGRDSFTTRSISACSIYSCEKYPQTIEQCFKRQMPAAFYNFFMDANVDSTAV